MDTDVFELQEMKKVGQSLYVSTLYSFVLAADITICLPFVIINGNHFNVAMKTNQTHTIEQSACTDKSEVT